MRTEDHAVRNDRLAAGLADTVARFLEQYAADPVALAAAATWMLDTLADIESTTAERRRAALRTLRADGWTLRQIAAEIGTTPARVDQILKQ